MRSFEKHVTWEFNTRVHGSGRNVREAYLDALEASYEAAQGASDFVMEAIERNELWCVDGKFPEPPPRPEPLRASGGSPPPETHEWSSGAIFLLILVFGLATMAFGYRYSEFMHSCGSSGRSFADCWDLAK